ncbi:MAG TPA: hypothetical protein DDY98_01290 [Ruminococcaceae bacterium]|nr:hypothetical protein [Oscillospiraceae bacterium]
MLVDMISNLIKRNTPELSDCFITEQCEEKQGMNFFRYEAKNGKVHIQGDCAVSMAVAYYAFLRDWCGGAFSVDHSLRYREFVLPTQPEEALINRKYRTCMEDTFFSCGACWWDWERWEKEIDFMAMNGINMPLCVVGTEAVWMRTMVEIGMSEPFALTDISGPSYWGWQLSNCYDGCVPQIRKETVEARIALGRRILEREKELGMKPILHSFSGYVSRLFIKSKLRARFNKAESWCKFPEQYQIATRDPAFMRIGSAFLKNQSLLLGDSDFYMADPYYAHAPAKKGDAFLAGIGTAILHVMTKHNENATWVLHASSAKPAMLKNLDAQRLLVLSDCLDDVPNGVPCLLTTHYNGCDVTALHGDASSVCGQRFDDVVQADDRLCGVGACTDGVDTNELFRQWTMNSLVETEADTAGWMNRYFKNRWKTQDDTGEIVRALLDTCYRPNQPKREAGSIICARPSVSPNHTSVGDAGCDVGYDNAILFSAVEKMLAVHADSYEYELDVCDFLRQALSNKAKELCQSALEGYRQKNVEQFETNTNAFLQLIEDLDRLLMTKKEFALPYHLGQAKKCGSTEDECQNYEINLLAQITIFGPVRDNDLYDCCWKDWGGLLKTFYLKRWRALFEYLAVSFKKRPMPERTKMQSLGRDAYLGSEFNRNLAQVERDWISKYTPEYDAVEQEDTLQVAKELMAQYK